MTPITQITKSGSSVSGGLAEAGALARVAERIRNGDGSAEEELVRQFSDRVRVFVSARTRDRELARDLGQEVMLHVLTALRRGQLREPERVGAFVYGIARNVVNNHFRTSADDRSNEELPEEIAAATLSPADEFEARQRQTLVRRALGRLDRGDSRILLMTLVDGLKPGEIADRLGLTSDVVRARKSRALKRIVERVHELSRTPQ
jgi:RNA polymerase sigma-70 factor (ECF subfamily)